MIPGVPRICISCGTLTNHGSRCQTCQTTLNRQRDARRGPRPHYQGDYAKRAKQIRDNATICHICGEGPRPNDPWQADHLQEGDPTSPLLAAHRSCNIRKAHEARARRDT